MPQRHTASPARFRGISAARAEGNPTLQTLNDVRAGFEDFRARHIARVDELETAFNAQAHQLDAMRLSGGEGIHPAAGLRGNGARIVPITGVAADNFRAQLRGNPSASMTTQSGPDGGFTVERDVDNVIDAVLRDLSPMRSLARVVGVTGAGWEKIIGRSGSQSQWAGEEEGRGETGSPILGKVTINPGELYAIPSLTNHVLQDSSFDLNAFLSEDVSGEFALAEGAAFVLGDGMNKPRGFLTCSASTEKDAARDFGKLQYLVTGQANGFAPSAPADILLDTLAALRPVYRTGNGVAWVMNSTTANIIRKFKDGQGNYLWTNSILAGQPDRLLGYPVAIDENMPDITSGGYAVAFGNWQRGYAVVDKTGTKLLVDPYTKKGWTKFYFSRRVGGGVVDSNAIKLLKFSA